MLKMGLKFLKNISWKLTIIVAAPLILPWLSYRIARQKGYDFIPAMIAALSVFLVTSLLYVSAFIPAFGILAELSPYFIGILAGIGGAAWDSVLIDNESNDQSVRHEPARPEPRITAPFDFLRSDIKYSKIMLSEKELLLTEQLTATSTPDNDARAQDIKLLKKLRERYLALKEKIDAVAQGLTASTELGDLDDLNPFGYITTPILLVKEYQVGESWLAVPNMSYITDYDFLRQWSMHQMINPLNRDSLLYPPAYARENISYETRYRFYPLNTQQCWAPELNEHAVHIQRVLTQLQPQSTSVVSEHVTEGRYSSQFFNNRVEVQPINITDASPWYSRLF